MLFNSYSFLVLFLPITLAGFFALGRRNPAWGAAWLGAASIVFYGWWNYAYVPLLLASILFNYGCGGRIAASDPAAGRSWLIFAIAADMLLLGYYKYANFFLANVAGLLGADIQPLAILLPIGISFFTFTQITFLVDTYRGEVREYRFVHYLLFVTYFPHLIAGPVLHHKEMMPQFENRENYRPSASHFAVGLSIFILGLAKKLLVADSLAPHANALFAAPDSPSLLVAWGGVLAYAFQLYFDFSGYSDMAIGLSRLFGVRLPLNFDSPYQSASIVEFWRRWHMTLSRFLRDYLYIPLGGNRRGRIRRHLNLMITMLLGGLWHGAGWGFVIWGGLHGLYLIVNHAWAGFCDRWGLPRNSRHWKPAAIALTFASVCFAWVFFRADTLDAATQISRGMLGGFGVGLPDAIGIRIGGLRTTLEQAGVVFYLGGGSRFLETWGWVFASALVAFFLPNTQRIMGQFEPALDFSAARSRPAEARGFLAWRPTPAWAVVIGILAVASLLSMNRPSEFLYFQF